MVPDVWFVLGVREFSEQIVVLEEGPRRDYAAKKQVSLANGGLVRSELFVCVRVGVEFTSRQGSSVKVRSEASE